jgi:hypothetical protein
MNAKPGLLDMPAPPQLVGERRVHRLAGPGDVEEDDGLPKAMDRRAIQKTANKEATMPKGCYPRKPRITAQAGATPEATPKDAKERKPRKTRAASPATSKRAPARREASATPDFAVWDDGSVQIDTDECKGRLLPDQAVKLVEFVQRLKGA